MISMNIRYFRKCNEMTQEQLAEKLNVTRQTVAKWESGDALPGINECINMSDIFNITIDDLVKDVSEEELPLIGPRGKHIFGMVTVGDRGQMVIPKEAREIFGIKPGDKLIVLGDEEQGIAIVKENIFRLYAEKLLESLKKNGEI